MRLTSLLNDKRIRGLVGGAFTASVGLLFLLSSLGTGLSDRSYDLSFRFRPPVNLESEEVVIVDMDHDSEIALGQPSIQAWDRTLHAQLLASLTTNHADIVVFDVFFGNTDQNLSAADEQLLQAAAAHGKVLFAALYRAESKPDGQPDEARLIRPFGSNQRVGLEQIGIIEQSFSLDRNIRQHSAGFMNVPSLAWRAATLRRAQPLSDPAAPRWLNHYGPPGVTTPHVSYHQIISNTVPPWISLTNRVVFVGARADIGPTGGTATDNIPTPYDKLAPGVEINATTYLNLVRGDWLRRLPLGAEGILFCLFGLLAGYAWSFLKPFGAAAFAPLAVVGVVIIAGLLFGLAHRWFPWLIVIAVQIPCAVGWSVLAHAAVAGAEPVRAPKPATTGAATSQPPAPSEQPTVVQPAATLATPAIPDHTLLRCVGKGAYGEVWLARDILGNYHAVKIVARNQFTSDGPYEREFKGIQKYTPISRSHPGWVHILHVGRNDAAGYFFYIMEAGDDETTGQRIDPATYVPKNLVRELQRRGRIPLEQCLPLGLALAAALEHLHQHLLIHRDIKPSNVIFVNGVPKFADIGLVTDLQSSGKDVSYLGTEGYIAPEGPGTAAADVYSLGKLLYEMSMGRDRLAFPELATSMVEAGNWREWRQLNEIILKACESDPRQRYQSAAQMHADLLRLQTDLLAQRQAASEQH